MIPLIERIKQVLGPIRYWTELPLQEVQNRAARQPAGPSRIPPVVVQTWEDRKFGKSHAREIEKFRDLNPELSFELWDKEQRLEYMEGKWGGHEIFGIYQRAVFGPMKADIFRYCLMADQGGFYFDISKGCSIPIRQLCRPETEALITFEPHESPLPCPPEAARHLLHPGKLVLQWGFGFAPGHPIPTRMIDKIVEAYPSFRNKVFAFPKDAIREMTGPIMFTRAVQEVCAESAPLKATQAGIDFDGAGIFALKGSKVRYITAPAYSKVRDSVIVT